MPEKLTTIIFLSTELFFTQVFDVVLNGEHTVVSELDIFAKVGRGVAHDEIVPFTIRNGKLKVNGETSQIDGNEISIEFIKVGYFFFLSLSLSLSLSLFILMLLTSNCS